MIGLLIGRFAGVPAKRQVLAGRTLRLGYLLSLLLILMPGLGPAQAIAAETKALVVGSKRFTESYVLGEIISQTLRTAGHNPVVLKPGLGNTGILLSALNAGEIDVYPEYTGTIAREILKSEQPLSLDQINAGLSPMGLQAGVLLGFDNAYVLAMRREQAQQLKISRISDLASHAPLVAGLSHEFIGRRDGWPGLAKAYGLTAWVPRGLDHGLAYEAIAAQQIDIVDAYGTDSKLSRYDLVVLADDRHFFPSYEALLLFRKTLPAQFPASWKALQGLEGTLTQDTMRALNTQVEMEGHSFEQVASGFVQKTKSLDTALPARKTAANTLFGSDFLRLTGEHVFLVATSLLMAMLLGIPLGALCFYLPRVGQTVLAVVGVVQTIPSLALLAFLISLFGVIGTVPAIAAVFLYALLPIVQSTCTSLAQVSPNLRQAATALGMSGRDRLWLIELPLAMPVILSGIKVAAVLSVGTATLAAFIGAGGFGDRIAQGLALNNTPLLLAGAVPAAGMALLIQWGFVFLERKLNKPGQSSNLP